ncbi:fe(2+) transport protein 1-like [Euphorbia lathyris]|uniref:fe(2+) transport protein 1-like n=1 Tax=Euphorbia lathyris TaxID=212925 RepID=UPI0033132479
MVSPTSQQAKITISLFVILSSTVSTFAEECNYGESGGGICHNTKKALKLKITAIGSILLSSMVGVCLPLLTHKFGAFHPDKNLFTVVKAFASGVILATGYMHVLPDAFECLHSPCLPENPWRRFPFTTFVAMLSAVLTLMVDSLAMSYNKKCKKIGENGEKMENDIQKVEEGETEKGSQALLRHRVVAQVLEAGIVVHSVVIGLSMGTSDNACTIRPLIAALCFHQLFEGMGLGGCILQAQYGMKMKGIMVMFFSGTTPLGIGLGMGLSKTYKPNSPTALIVVGILNASSAGLLNYMALVDLLAAEFLGPKLQQNIKLQFKSYLAVLLGAGGMSLMAIWA